jgi:hypothetical protein
MRCLGCGTALGAVVGFLAAPDHDRNPVICRRSGVRWTRKTITLGER